MTPPKPTIDYKTLDPVAYHTSNAAFWEERAEFIERFGDAVAAARCRGWAQEDRNLAAFYSRPMTRSNDKVQKLTREQAAILSLYTGFLCGPFSDMHELAEKVMGRPIWTHQFADRELVDKMKQAVKPKFLELCPEE